MKPRFRELRWLPPITLALGGFAQAQFTLVDDMEGVDNWTNLQGTTGLATDPVDGSNTAFQAVGDAVGGSRGQAYLPMPTIADGTTGTVFFRLYTEAPVANTFDWVVGSSDKAAPVAGFGDYDGYGRLADGFADVRNTGANATGFSQVGPVSAGTWYNVWLVQNNTADTTDMYVNITGNATTAATISFAGGAFRNAAGDLVTLLVRNNENSGNAYIDDVYIDVSGQNLTDPVNPFVDNDPVPDGMDDNWEIANFGSIEFSDGTTDQEPDGLTDLQEYLNDTDPNNEDSDGDGLNDGPEVNATLNDGITPTGFAATSPNKKDSDAGVGGVTDGVNDFDEITGALNTQFGNASTDPNNPDTDADGMHDGYELTCNSSALTALDPNDNGDTDGTQAPNGDRDGDTLFNIEEFNPSLGPNDLSPQTRADLSDTDGDGYDDRAEDNFKEWLDASATGSNPTIADTDGDGLDDGDENLELAFSPGAVPTNSNPNLRDTDGDGFIDSFEVASSTNPDDESSVPTRPTGFTLVEDFEGAGMVVGNTIDGVNAWSVDRPNDAVVADEPIAGGDQVGCLARTGAGTSEPHKLLDTIGLQINEGGTGTLFFQVYAETTSVDMSLGLSDVISPTGFADFEAQSVLAAGDIRVRDSGAFENVGMFAAGVWMNVWVVADNAADTMKVYVETPDGETGQVEVTLPIDPVAFRNGTSGSLSTLLTIVGGGSGVSEAIYLDNFYIDPDAANITVPAGVAAKPVAGDAPMITDVFLEAGDLKITFSPGGAGFILTSSNDLIAPFLEETNATYDNVDTFTVPAAFLNPGKDFFRVETE